MEWKIIMESKNRPPRRTKKGSGRHPSKTFIIKISDVILFKMDEINEHDIDKKKKDRERKEERKKELKY